MGKHLRKIGRGHTDDPNKPNHPLTCDVRDYDGDLPGYVRRLVNYTGGCHKFGQDADKPRGNVVPMPKPTEPWNGEVSDDCSF